MARRSIFKRQSKLSVIFPLICLMFLVAVYFHFQSSLEYAYRYATIRLGLATQQTFTEADDAKALASRINTLALEVSNLQRENADLQARSEQLTQLEKSLRIPRDRHTRFIANVKLTPHISSPKHDRYALQTKHTDTENTFALKGHIYLGRTISLQGHGILISPYDGESAVPVVLPQAKVATILQGRGSQMLPISTDIPDFHQIKAGEKIYTRKTSSFPGSLLVGTVVDVIKNHKNRSVTITVLPAANFSQLAYAQLIRQ